MLRLALICLVTFAAGTVWGAGQFPKPLSYAKPVGTDFVFVQLGDAAEEAKHGTASQRTLFLELRAKYAKPGLYRTADGVLVWDLPAGEYAPIDYVYLTNDGASLVRIDGDFWQTESFPGGTRPSESKQQTQLAGNAVSFFRNGKLLRVYRLHELIRQTETLKHTPEHLIWYAGGSLNENTGRFLLDTQESRRLTFDYATGVILEERAVGLANPVLNAILIAAGAMSLLILGFWIRFVYRNRVPAASAAMS